MEKLFREKVFRYLAERREKSGIAVSPSLLEACDAAREELGIQSRNDFVEIALRFLLYSCNRNSSMLKTFLSCDHAGESVNGKYKTNGGA